MPHALTAAQLKAYHRDGYVHVRGLLTPAEAAAYRTEVNAIAERQGVNDATWESVKGGGTSIRHRHDVHFASAAFTRLLVDPRLTGIAQDIISRSIAIPHRSADRSNPCPTRP